MRLTKGTISVYSIFSLTLVLAILIGISAVLWDRVINGSAVATNPTFQTTLLFVIILGIGKILHNQKK